MTVLDFPVGFSLFHGKYPVEKQIDKCSCQSAILRCEWTNETDRLAHYNIHMGCKPCHPECKSMTDLEKKIEIKRKRK